MNYQTFANRLLTLLILSLLIPAISNGAYLRNIPQTLVQPDGQVIHCFASGDEFYNWLHDENNFTIVQDPNTGYFVYAIQENNVLQATALIVGKVDPRSKGIAPNAILDEKERMKRRNVFFETLKMTAYQAPHSGPLNNVVIFIRFSDQSEYTQPISFYEGRFNTDANSMRNYFLETSYNVLGVLSHFYPAPATGIVRSYQDGHPRSHYQRYNVVANPGGYVDDDDRRLREHTLLRDALNAISSQIPNTLDIDGDNDGLVDNVCFIIQGTAEGWNDLLWPHRWSLSSFIVRINNIIVRTYNFQLSGAGFSTGVLCHEMFHSLGAPDLYHYQKEFLYLQPVGWWDLMESSTNPPQHMGAYMKHRYGQWIATIPTITSPGTYTLNSLTSATNNCYRINSPNSTGEYFVVEYRRRTGTFESSLPDEGLLVYRINSAQDGKGNADGPPDEVYIYRPGGTTTTNGWIWGANFSSDFDRIGINDDTDPACFLANGSDGGICISNISPIGNTISFTLGVGIADFIASPTHGEPPLVVNFTDRSTGCILSRTIDFGDGTPPAVDVPNPTHTYTKAGSYTVSLTVTGTGGDNTKRITDYIFVNTLPTASNLAIDPAIPRTKDNLKAVYSYYDGDGDPQGATQIRWYKNGILQSTYNNNLTIPFSATTKGEQWNFTVRPHDGKEYGSMVTSPTVLIHNTPPVVSELVITPVKPLDEDDLVISFTYADDDGDVETGSEIHWYKNSIHQPAYDNFRTLPASATTPTKYWHFSVRPNDGEDFGTIAVSAPVPIDMRIIIEAETMQGHKSWYGNPCEDGWRLTHPDQPIFDTFEFPADFLYRLTVIAKGEMAYNEESWLKAQVGAGFTGACEIAATEWANYTFVASVDSGAQPLILTFLNDWWNLDSGDRNLLIDKIILSCQFDPLPRTSFTFEAEAMSQQNHTELDPTGNYAILPKYYSYVAHNMFFERTPLDFEIIAKADSAENGWPEVELWIDNEVRSLTVNNASPASYFFTVTGLTTGPHCVKIDGRNDTWTSGFKLYIDKLIIHTTDGGLLKQDSNEPFSDQKTVVDTPKEFALQPNHPNPFNPETSIDYQVPEASFVTIKIFNVLGEEIRTLVDESKPAGFYSVKWDGRNNYGSGVVSGIYLYQIQAGSFNCIRKMALMK
jgi:M6 family metalloprotease-like protein